MIGRLDAPGAKLEPVMPGFENRRSPSVEPPLRREVFLRRRLDEQDAATVAEALGIGRSAVEKHVTRAVADLRRALEKRGLALEGGR